MTAGKRLYPDYWAIADEILTPKQLRILQLRERHGFTLRQIAYTIGSSVSNVTGTLDRCHQLIDLHSRKQETA